MPSIENNKILQDKVKVELEDTSYIIDVYETSLGKRWLKALADNLSNKRILEKNFCFLGFADSKRDLRYLVGQLNDSINQINSFTFEPTYGPIHPFVTDDFQFSSTLPIGKAINGNDMATPGKRLKHEACNKLHRYFEELQGTPWAVSNFYKQADHKTKYAIRQLNNICHEIESWVNADRKKAFEPEWMRPSQITTFLNSPRYDLNKEDFDLFKQNRYDRTLGGVYLHWSQVGKTLYEVFRDEHAPKMTDALCSEINHQKYYSGEFDVEWGKSINESEHFFKKKEMEEFRNWLADNNFDWQDSTLSLGYIKLGQVNLLDSFGTDDTIQIHKIMSNNLNIKSICVLNADKQVIKNDFPYTLDSKDWQQIQIEGLKAGYESRSMR